MIFRISLFRSFFFLVGASIILSSCITNKKLQYFQKDDVNKKNLLKDTVVRSYDLERYDYRVQPHDALVINFESVTSAEFDFLSKSDRQNVSGAQGGFILNSELVNDKGDISFPVIGDVKVVGLTIFEIQEKLQALANQFLEEVVVKVRLVNFRFTVLGEVNSEGTVVSYNSRVTLPEALGLSGGAGELADRSNIKVIRQQNGKLEVGYVDLLNEDIAESPYYYIHQNDVLIVPALRQRPFRRYFGPNLSLFVSSLSLLILVLNLNK